MKPARPMISCAILLSALTPIGMSRQTSNSEKTSVPAADVQEHVAVTEISPQVLVFATSAGNVVASVGVDGALLIGTPSIASTPEISEMLAKRTKSGLRYVVMAPQDPAQSQGDAGWGKLGAFVIMHENALQRIGGHAMGPPPALPERLLKMGVDRPHVAFSEVVTFDMNGDSVHIIHQKPAYSDADSVVHFHVAKVVYLGEVFPGDGYPMVDAAQGGSLNGVVDMLSWTDKTFHIVPARGAVATGADVKEFRSMIVTLRDRVNNLVKEGRTEEQIVAAHPTAEFDARWGHGRVSPDAFVRELYRAAKEPKATPPERKN
jgi:cyclase